MENRNLLIFGIAFLAIYLAWGAFLICAVAKNEPKKKQSPFDERQIAAQGKGYQWAFWAMFAYYLLYSIVAAGGLVWCDPVLGMFLGVMIGCGTFGVVCVLKDAFFRPGQSRKGLIFLWNIIALGQLSIGISHLKEHTLVENGVLSGDCLQFGFLLMVVLLDGAYWMKRRMEKREEQE